MQSYNSTSRRLRLNSHTNSQLNSQPKQSSPVLKLPQPNTAPCSPVQPRPAKTSQLNRPYTLCVLSFSAFFFPREQFHFGNKCGNKSRWLLLLSFDSCFHSCTKVLVFLENILTLNKVLSQRVRGFNKKTGPLEKEQESIISVYVYIFISYQSINGKMKSIKQ